MAKRGGFGGPSQAKRPKNEDEEDTPTFEDHLAGLEDDDDFMDFDAGDVLEGEGPAQEATTNRWARPLPPPLNPKQDSLVFQQVCSSS